MKKISNIQYPFSDLLSCGVRRLVGGRNSERGMALIFTLAILVLVTVLALTIFMAVTSEKTESAASSRQGDAQRLAAGVVDLVKSTITQATSGYQSNASTGAFDTSKPVAWASQPGLIRTWDTSGNPYRSYRLYSSGNISVTAQADLVADTTELANWKSGAPSGAGSYNALWCDLNAPALNPANGLTYPIVTPPADRNSGSTATDASHGVPTDNPATAVQEGVQGFSIASPPGYTSGNATAINNPAPMPVKWLYVLQDGSYVSPTGTGSIATVAGATQANPIVGRVAYWTDDDTSKVNINTASEGVFWDKPYAYNREEAGVAGGSPVLGYALSVPAQDEFQRIAGHPAFTSLSAVLGGWMPRPDIGFSNSGSNGAAAYTGGTYSDNLLPYYNITPRAGDGGTKGGTRAVLDLAAAGNAVALGTARLYTGGEELLYQANRSVNQVNLTSDRIQKTGFFLTANSKAPETTLFEQPRISLWPIQQGVGARNAKDRLLAFASTINANPFYFQRVSEWQSDDVPGSSQSATTDASLPRNDTLLNYLLNSAQQTVPGFGASLSSKYTGGRLPQILFGMFDSIRSLVNTTSRALTPAYTYAPYGTGWPWTSVSLGSVVPARATLGGTEVKGFGRFPTVKEVVIVFMASAWKDETTLGAAAPWTPMPGFDNLPDDVAANDGTFNGVGDPQTTHIRAFVFVVTENIAPGQPDAQAAVRYQIEGLNTLQVNGTNVGFPSANSAVLTTRGVNSQAKLTEVPPVTQFSSAGLFQEHVASAIARQSGVSDGVTGTTVRQDPKEMIFPFIGTSIPLPAPAQPSRFGLDAAGNYQDLRPSVVPTTMAFSGGTLKIRVYPGSGNTFSANDYLQEIEVNLPAATLPAPQITRSTFSTSPGNDRNIYNIGPDFDATVAETDRNQASFYSGLRGEIADSRNFNMRLRAEYSYAPWARYAGASQPQCIIRRGDVMRSVYLDPSGPARGDIRLVAGLRHVPSSFFAKFPDYDNTNKLQATSSMAYQTTTLDTNPHSWNRQANRDPAEYRGKLVDLAYNSLFLPHAPKGMTAANLGSSSNPGDWNTGVGGNFDGAYINLADQGFVQSTSDMYTNVYFPSNLVDAGGAASLASFSPNRQIASPALFGSLPSGVTPLSSLSASGTQSPWQTLLFAPNPAAKNNHPGFSAGGNGTGPDARPPYTTAPDHLFLDQFWMPVVEPYAISEPFSTAGKVNLNFQIAPFAHIERSTGIHAVLKAMKIPAIPDSRAVDYRRGWMTYMATSEPGTPSWRYNIDVDAVVAGMKNRRFDNNDIYRSASEVCNIFMVPSKQPNATAATPAGPSGAGALQRYNATANWWDDKTLTGDNLRESPYNYVYPRITTKSNTYTVHLRVQAIKQVSSRTDWATWDEAKDQVVSEYRGSTTLERYVDPNDTNIPDFALPANYSKNLAPYYRWRTVMKKQFVP